MSDAADKPAPGVPSNGRHPAARPTTPDTATPERRSIDERGTLYAPTSVSLDTGAFIDTGCPIDFEVTENDTLVQFGDTNTTLLLTFADQALIDAVLVLARAARAMLIGRGMPILEELGREPG